MQKNRGNSKKPRGKKPTPGSDKISRVPAVLEESTRSYQIYSMLLSGYSQNEIAKELGIDRGTVATLVSHASSAMTKEAMALKEQVFVLNVMRLEKLIKIGFKHLEETIKENKVEDPRMFEALGRMIKTSSEIANGPESKQINVDQHISLTITAGDELYRKAMDNDYRNKPDVIAAREDTYQVVDDPRISRLSGLITGGVEE